jgi:hypothetical protein
MRQECERAAADFVGRVKRLPRDVFRQAQARADGKAGLVGHAAAPQIERDDLRVLPRHRWRSEVPI